MLPKRVDRSTTDRFFQSRARDGLGRRFLSVRAERSDSMIKTGGGPPFSPC
jgi:hypothetical protein